MSSIVCSNLSFAWPDDTALFTDLSFTVGDGRTGLVAPNGAGKSTLLRVISRVLPPTEGRVLVRGRVAPILELGLGFHGELTGRENVMLQGALLGFTRAETRKRLDRIVEWAELEEFIDAPIRTYSTGMAARLAFSVATDAEPDILLVSHQLKTVRENCERSIWLHHGRVVIDADTPTVSEAYHQWSLGDTDAVG